MKRVAIIGGGVSGLSAAQELLANGFAVDIYERNAVPGGKARSLEVPASNHAPTAGRKLLPAEHGFRFFPGFYRHLDETMENIRSPTGASVRDTLVCIDRMNYGRFGKNVVAMPAGAPDRFKDFLKILKKWLKKEEIGMPFADLLKYWVRLAAFFSSCDERIQNDYEHVPWWCFLRAENASLHYRRFFASSSRILVAADPRKASTKTNGMITEQFIFDLQKGIADRVLPGPTNQTWLFPWLRQLHDHANSRLYFNADVTEILADPARRLVTGLVVRHRDDRDAVYSRLIDVDTQGGPVLEPEPLPQEPVRADYYLCATPVEAAARYLGNDTNWSDLANADPSLQGIVELQHHTQWMNGVMFYLTGKIKALEDGTLRGHSVYVDTPFALTSIFQEQHWDTQHFPMSGYGKGDVAGICSVCVSNWNDTEPTAHGLPNGGRGRIHDKSATQTVYDDGNFATGKSKLIEELWTDLKESLIVDGRPVLDDSNLLHWYIDPAIHLHDGLIKNSEPLLVNRVDSWRLRPKTTTALPNFFLAGDYVRTNTDLATMEAACESGLRASNAILDCEGRPDADKRIIHPLKRLPEFALFRAIDKLIYKLRS